MKNKDEITLLIFQSSFECQICLLSAFFGGTFLLVLVFLEFLIVFFQLSSQGFRKVASSPSFNQSNSVLHLTLVGCLPFFILLKKVSNCYR